MWLPVGELLPWAKNPRKNADAVDKVAGWALRGGLLPLAGHVLLVSGRASFELAQKAVMIGVPVLAVVSAPSSLAASLAEETGLTLVGFLRGATMNVYAGAQRVTGSSGMSELITVHSGVMPCLAMRS